MFAQEKLRWFHETSPFAKILLVKTRVNRCGQDVYGINYYMKIVRGWGLYYPFREIFIREILKVGYSRMSYTAKISRHMVFDGCIFREICGILIHEFYVQWNFFIVTSTEVKWLSH